MLTPLYMCYCFTDKPCEYDGQFYAHQDTLRPEPSINPCKVCTCNNGQLECKIQDCPAVNCPDPVAVEGECCPTCPGESVKNTYKTDPVIRALYQP